MQVIDLLIHTYPSQMAMAIAMKERPPYRQVELFADIIYLLIYGITHVSLLGFLFKEDVADKKVEVLSSIPPIWWRCF